MRLMAILIAVVLATSAANAQMEISVDGLLGWETDFTLTPGDTLSIGVGSWSLPEGGFLALGLLEGGPASLDISEISVYPPPMSVNVNWWPDPPVEFGLQSPAFIIGWEYLEMPPPAPGIACG